MSDVFLGVSMGEYDPYSTVGSSSIVKCKLPTDSGQNSLEYWDYSLELELLDGPQGNYILFYSPNNRQIL